MKISSPAFENGGTIPQTFTCDGKNESPPLVFSEIPEGTKSLVLIMHDPDAPAGDFTHWLVYSIPPTVKGLPRNLPKKPVLEKGILQGVNDFGFVGYGGPCPPPWDGPHRYYFELYALDYEPNLKPGATREEVERALEGHVIENATLMGRYKRTKPFMFGKLSSP
ncbi:MAG: YbhB/YbcL family Raf kinase inhibitor-like protein [Aquificae bacterium]|nr:YbhB/YbcL family Raf kinase inhibitor-like protein [Aquificota bacterium]